MPSPDMQPMAIRARVKIFPFNFQSEGTNPIFSLLQSVAASVVRRSAGDIPCADGHYRIAYTKPMKAV